MGYEVCLPFKDKTRNKKRYDVGDSYSHENKERIAFLVERGFIKEATPAKKAKKKTEKK